MARYNAWQSKQLRPTLDAMDEEELHRDHGAFFASLFATMNHLLWGDTLWISRFDGGPGSDRGIKDSVDMTPNYAEWARQRFLMDGRITLWAERLRAIDLTGDYSWYSGAMEAQVSKPLALCITHFFNHQTHHRGQIHAMLTAAGHKAPVSDLFFLPSKDT